MPIATCMCGPLHAHMGCMGAEDKMAGNTHALQRWSLLHACHNTGHSSAKCDKAHEHTQARLSNADRHACVGPCINSHTEATTALRVACMGAEDKDGGRHTRPAVSPASLLAALVIVACATTPATAAPSVTRYTSTHTSVAERCGSPCTTCVHWHLAYVHGAGAAMVLGFGEHDCAYLCVRAARCTWLNGHACV